MAGGGFIKLPNGNVVVALWLPRPQLTPSDQAHEPLRVRVVVHAANRARALTRLRNLGLRAVYLRGNSQPPTPDETTAVLHHPDGLIWRADLDDDTELWHPIRALLRPVEPPPTTRPRTVTAYLPHGSDPYTWEHIVTQWSAELQPPRDGATERSRQDVPPSSSG
jgi:hypothetical protein